MERTRPSRTSASSACHVSRMEGSTSGPTLPVTGQWMR